MGVEVRSRRAVRTKVVWSVLALSMSALVGLLMVLDSGSPRTHTPGVSLSPLMSVGQSRGVEAIFNTTSELDESRWDSIVIVHSGSPAGSPASIGAEHEGIGYDGLGFHFVIGNGTGMGDGEIHLGRRWITQTRGAQLSGIEPGDSDSMIEICLVGNGDRRPFTDEQVRYLALVVDALSERLGIDASRVFLHEDLAPTTSPGRYFPRASFRELIASR